MRLPLAVIGGSAPLLKGTITRVTRDVDVVAFVEGEDLRGEPSGTDVLAHHVWAVALDLGLDPAWLNLGPVSLLDAGLPEGFLARCRIESVGASGFPNAYGSRTHGSRCLCGSRARQPQRCSSRGASVHGENVRRHTYIVDRLRCAYLISYGR